MERFENWKAKPLKLAWKKHGCGGSEDALQLGGGHEPKKVQLVSYAKVLS